MNYRELRDSMLAYRIDLPPNLGNHESLGDDNERYALNWVVHHSVAVKAWEPRSPADELRRPPKIFEIGTYWGLSLISFASMVPGAELHSLDISGDAAVPPSPQPIIRPAELGKNAKERRIPYTQWLGDSLTFDYAKLPAPFDVVFVDGRHDREHALNDTEKTWPLLAPGGVMVWHDYKTGDAATVEMIAALNELDDQRFSGRLTHIRGTSLVYFERG